jgi:hypothetical protein
MSNENIEPTTEEIVEPTEEQQEVDPDAKTMSLRDMSYLLTSQTFTIIGALGEGLKARYDQLTNGIPPKAKQNQFNKGYIQALNDIAAGLMAYQDEITERGIADGILVREEPQATATDVVEGSE